MMLDHPVLRRSTADTFATWLDAARTTGAVALIDKPEDWTSFDCVAKLRNLTRVKKVGHAGTLDPLATGLLILCFGKATKDIAILQDADKAYDVTIRLGARTATDDRGAAEEVTPDGTPIDAARITEALAGFAGEITQTPPAFAAIRHNGRRQYDLAREGKEFTPRERVVIVHGIDNVTVAWPDVSCTIGCGKGTYIRSIARDLGDRLGCGGYVWSLRRTAIGPYPVTDALTIEDVQALMMTLTT